jgi:F0F1-type ATP synthase assembly protein I
MATADKREINEQLGSSHGSFELVVSPIVLGLLGRWIDGKVGSGPWVMIGLAVFGVVGAFTKLYLEYRFRMAAAAEADRAARAASAADHVAQRNAAAVERAELDRVLAAELADAEARARHLGHDADSMAGERVS